MNTKVMTAHIPFPLAEKVDQIAIILACELSGSLMTQQGVIKLQIYKWTLVTRPPLVPNGPL